MKHLIYLMPLFVILLTACSQDSSAYETEKLYTAPAANHNEPLHNLIANSHLSPEAQSSLFSFTENILQLQHGSQQALYSYLTTYKAGVTNSKVLNDEDKRVILTMVSLSKNHYDSFAPHQMATGGEEGEDDDDGDREDPDWDLVVTDMIDMTERTLGNSMSE
ncbi:hypothetical protein OOZ15_11965 [Galbibacter sp. EGI 63066]|uniref:hypothetical protein n=1 Tax=Galbibacter sp. EGI 63066 TaxID=2993559 RepID=UPI0022494D18|nr:hypothetical protein [Galbibacter sp. EGI 63066]MCX2680660.1 hypothetical protein [Galbibacter sp. EGI 63066]